MRGLKVLLVAIIVAGLAVGFFVFMPFGPDKETFVEIAPGTGTVGIAEQLSQAGVVRSALAFEVVKKLKGLTAGPRSQTLKAGEYRFDHEASITEVYDRLRRGDVYTVTLVVPEGFNIFDIAAAVEAAGLGSKADFLAAEKAHTELIAQWSPHASSLEGFLFPDTYKFGRHATSLQMLTAMVKRFQVVVARLGVAGSGVRGLEAGSSAALRNDNQKGKNNNNSESKNNGDSESKNNGDSDSKNNGDSDSKNKSDSDRKDNSDSNGNVEGDGRESGSAAGGAVARLVTMASLVEKEVHLDAERPVVAGVFRNRLARGMPLQTDPAVIYASMLRGTWTGVIHQSELHSDSAYTTYAHGGLPPGPICSPGLAALKAALHPADTNYLYFVADANGATRFAATLKEHDANVGRYKGVGSRE